VAARIPRITSVVYRYFLLFFFRAALFTIAGEIAQKS
jgi:hypothetical protein